MPEDGANTSSSLTLGDSIAILALVFSVIAFVVVPTWWLRTVFLFPATLGSTFLIWRSHWTHRLGVGIKAITSCMLALSIFTLGVVQIEDQLKTEHSWGRIVVSALDVKHDLFLLFTSLWFLRCVCVVIGIAITLLFQWLRKTIISLRSRNLSLSQQKKGLLDYKIQAEKSMVALVQITNALTEIVLQSNTSTQNQTKKIQAGTRSSSTTVQMKMVGESARAMDKHSRMLQAKGAELEQIGRIFPKVYLVGCSVFKRTHIWMRLSKRSYLR
jgi:hypothetical protein